MNINKLKLKMKKNNYDDKELASKLNIPQYKLNSRLNGNSQFTIEEVLNIIEVLKIDNPVEIFFD